MNEKIFDYYLSKAEGYCDTEIAKNKKEILDKVINDREPKGPKDIHNFYPKEEDLKDLPKNSVLIKISFTLKKPYTSKDEGEFHIIEEDFLFRWRDKRKIKRGLNGRYGLKLDEKNIKIEDNRIVFKNDRIEGKIVKNDEFATVFINDKLVDILIVKKEENEINVYSSKIFENPLVRDKFTGLPMVRPSTWKGHLRFAAERVEWEKEEDKKKIIQRLFGSESGEEKSLKGRIYFFPTFFEEEAKRDVITPLKRDTRTPVSGPISIEIMKSKAEGEFYLLYIPYPKEKDLREEEVKEDLKFLAEALKLMFYTYGFSAKKTSGFGVIEKLKEDNIEVHPGDKKDVFSILYTRVNNNVNHSV